MYSEVFKKEVNSFWEQKVREGDKVAISLFEISHRLADDLDFYSSIKKVLADSSDNMKFLSDNLY